MSRHARLHRTSARLLVATALALLAADGTHAQAGAPGPVTRQGAALRRLDIEGFRLLPAAIVARLPTGDASATSAIPAFERDHVAGLREGRSYSIGTASRGYLIGGRALPDDLGFVRRRPSTRRKRSYYGTDELVAALTRAAGKISRRWPTSVLWMGCMSWHGGGDLPGHASHNSGRDADLTFYMRDPAGRIADSPMMYPIRADGKGAWGGLDFDIPRNWSLVEALLRDSSIQVQWLLVARHIEHLLIAYAEKIGVDPTLRERAAAVMRQPTTSSPHMEHFHLRIYCSLDERMEGCLDPGPKRDWVDTHDGAIAQRVAEVLPFLKAGGADELRYAITRLTRLRARGAAEHLAALVEHPDPQIRELVADSIAFLRGERTPPRWSHLTEDDIEE